MADVMETLKGILGDDAEDKINNAMSTLTGNDEDNSVDYVSEMKQLIDRMGGSRSDPRANLLMSLRPYLRESRRQSIDGAVRLLNLSKLSGLLNIR